MIGSRLAAQWSFPGHERSQLPAVHHAVVVAHVVDLAAEEQPVLSRLALHRPISVATEGAEVGDDLPHAALLPHVGGAEMLAVLDEADLHAVRLRRQGDMLPPPVVDPLALRLRQAQRLAPIRADAADESAFLDAQADHRPRIVLVA